MKVTNFSVFKYIFQIAVNLREFGAKVYFPTIEPSPPNKLKFEDLDLNTQQQLQDIIERDIFTFNK